VVRTRVGYAGGTTKYPTYTNLDGHGETIQIDYDPEQISYEELLEVFWQSHNPTSPSYSTQYASIILVHDEEQERLAQESKQQEAEQRGAEIHTEIVPYSGFTLAEGYHQKYQLRNASRLMAEFLEIYPEPADFVNSTAAARVNGYVGGNGTLKQLEAELGTLGLSPEGQELLLQTFRR
jgi:methionine-S-sulfoxide reductase